MSNFLSRFFTFLGLKKMLKLFLKHQGVRTEKLHQIEVKIGRGGGKFFFHVFAFSYRLKFDWNLSLNT